MIVGSGLIASEFQNINLDNYIIFASGVSDATETRESEFNREKELLEFYLNNFSDKTLVYFNSILTTTNINNPYYNHKRNMINLLKKYENYKIYNIPQIFGKIGNNTNIVNYFISCLKNNQEIYLQKDTYRSIIDVYDLKCIVLKTLQFDIKEFNISYIERLQVSDILNIISDVYDIKPVTTYKESGFSVNIENDVIVDKVIDEINIQRTEYTKNVIKKYNKK